MKASLLIRGEPGDLIALLQLIKGIPDRQEQPRAQEPQEPAAVAPGRANGKRKGRCPARHKKPWSRTELAVLRPYSRLPKAPHGALRKLARTLHRRPGAVQMAITRLRTGAR